MMLGQNKSLKITETLQICWTNRGSSDLYKYDMNLLKGPAIETVRIV